MANVLKSDSPAEKVPAARSVSGLAGFNLSDLADEGRSRLDQCREQIRQMLSDAEKQAEEMRLQAKQRGYRAGRFSFNNKENSCRGEKIWSFFGYYYSKTIKNSFRCT